MTKLDASRSSMYPIIYLEENCNWPFISVLASQNPCLTTLSLKFHNRDLFRSRIREKRIRVTNPWPPLWMSRILFSLSFPNLVDFHLELLQFEWSCFSGFLQEHSRLHSFGLCTDNLDPQSLERLPLLIPNVTYLRGCTDFIEVFLKALHTPLEKVTKLFVYDWKGSDSGIISHIMYIFPQLPNLLHCQVRVEGTFKDPQNFISISKICVGLKSLGIIIPDGDSVEKGIAELSSVSYAKSSLYLHH